MLLTRRKTSPPDPNKFPAAQLFLLALIRLSEPIAITSIFPYAWEFVRDFHIGDPANASFYAGILISAFNLAEALSGVYWGGISDKLGRRPVLFLGSTGTIVTLLTVGFATSFWMALFGRLFGGLLNGNVGVIQTMVAEIVVNPAHEPKAYAVMPFVWSVGIIIGPAVGGYFASPAKNFPDTVLDNWLFRRFPYALPNIICSILLLVSILLGYLLLDETHPDMQPWSTKEDLEHTHATTPAPAAQGTTMTPAVNLTQAESYGTFNNVSEDAIEEEWLVRPDGTSRPQSIRSKDSEKAFTRPIVLLMVALGIFTYHSMTYDHLMPIFFQDERRPLHSESFAAMTTGTIGSPYGSFAGGLGMSVQQCGIILAINGVIALFVQAVIFPVAASWMGIWTTFMVVTMLHPVAYFIVPWVALLPNNLIYAGVYTCLMVRNLTSILAYPVLLILIKEAAPSNSCLGKINGLAASVGGACRTVASPLAGLLYSVGDRIEFTALAWWASALVAVIGAIQAFSVRRERRGAHHRVSAAFLSRNSGEAARRRKSSVIRIRVSDSGYNSGNEDGTATERRPLFASRVGQAEH